MGKIGIVVTLDTKGEEAKYLKEKIEQRGHGTVIIDTAMKWPPRGLEPDVTRNDVAKAGGYSIDEVKNMSRGEGAEIMSKGLAKVVTDLYKKGELHGLLSIGGAGGTALGTYAMRALPVGVPKLMVSTMASGKRYFGDYVGTKDLVMMHSVADILGINRLTRKIFNNAVGAICGMVESQEAEPADRKKTVALTAYGNTQPHADVLKPFLENAGYEVVVFHANGAGGRAMEELIKEDMFDAVVDLTTHEVADNICDGLHSAGPDRLRAAAETGIPQVVVPGCIDIILAGPPKTLPEKYQGRKIYFYNPLLSLVRVSKEEMIQIADDMAAKLNKSTAPIVIAVPLKGLSMYSYEGGQLWDPEADKAFLERLKEKIRPDIEIKTFPNHINDAEFAKAVGNLLIEVTK